MESAGQLSAIPSATGGIARLACARVAASGQDTAALLSKAGLTLNDFRDPAVRLEVRTQIKILELAAQELEDDILGFRLARSFDLREIGLVYYVMASSENVADALRAAERYSRIMNDGIQLRFEMVGLTATLALEYVGVDRRSDRHPDRILAGDAGSDLQAGDRRSSGAVAAADEASARRDARRVPDVLWP